MLEDFVIQAPTSGVQIPAGAYQTTFSGVELIETQKGDAVKFSFLITNGEYKDKYATSLCDPPSVHAPTPLNKLGRILSGLAGKTLEPGMVFNPKSVIGKAYTVVVAPGPKGGKPSVVTVVAAATAAK